MMGGHDIGHHEGIGIIGTQEVASLLGQVSIMALFINGEEEILFLRIELLFRLVLVQLHLRSFQATAVGRIDLGIQKS